MEMPRVRAWMPWALRLSAAHYAVLGASFLLLPQMRAAGSPTTFGPVMVVLAISLMFASRDPVKHWLLSLFALLFNGILMLEVWPSLQAAEFSIAPFAVQGWNFAFAMILAKAWEANRHCRMCASPEVQRFALRAKTQYDISLLEMSQLSPVLIVFLRHLGCAFCREALSDLSKQRKRMEKDGVRVALVHMATENQAAEFLAKYGLEDIPRVSDPTQSVYRAFGLERGKVLQLFGLKTWKRGVETYLHGHRQGLIVGDSFQMPGVFLIFHGEVLRAYRHQSPADRPNYVALAIDQDYPIAS
jgi:peroxiredoxin